MQWKPLAAAACLAFVPLGVAAAPSQGDGVFTLSGSGTSDDSLDSNIINVTFDLGKYMTKETVVGVRQSVGIADVPGENAWNGATRIFADYHFDQRAWQPFVGANIGGVYGDNIDETFFAGPELGVKYYMKEETFVTVQAEYQVFFSSTDDVESNYDDGAFVYSAGIGINF